MGRLLAIAVDSALAQTRPATDILVVDDGSTDDTLAVARSYGDRIRVISQSNGGVSKARNAGAAAARGNWFLFLDADDALLPGALAHFSETAQAVPAGVIFGRTEQVDEETQEVRDRFNANSVGPPPQPARANFWRSAIPTPGAAIVRRDLHERIGGFEKPWQPTEDRDYWMKCGMLEPFALCDHVVLRKLRRAHSSRVNENPAVFWGMRVQLEFLDWCRARHLDTAFLETTPSEICARALERAIQNRDRTTGRHIQDHARKRKIPLPWLLQAKFHLLCRT